MVKTKSTQLDPTSHKTIKRGSTQPINHPTSNLKHTQIKNISKQNLDPQQRPSCDPATAIHHGTTYHYALILLKP